MRIPRIYLETTMFNFYYADDAPDKKQDTIRLFEEIRLGKYIPFTSEYVMRELAEAGEEKRILMTDLVREYNVEILEAQNEADRLAKIYVLEGVIPEKYFTDGLHIAITAANDLDFIVSLNFKHIVKRKTIMMSEVINIREGYKKVGIYSPMEVVEYDD